MEDTHAQLHYLMFSRVTAETRRYTLLPGEESRSSPLFSGVATETDSSVFSGVTAETLESPGNKFDCSYLFGRIAAETAQTQTYRQSSKCCSPMFSSDSAETFFNQKSCSCLKDGISCLKTLSRYRRAALFWAAFSISHPDTKRCPLRDVLCLALTH
jgi:hypothetical protein